MKSARWIVGWALVSASVAACDAGEVSAQRDSSVQRDATVSGQDGSMITPTADGSASGPDASAMGGDASGDGGPISVGPARPEECGNAVDDDNDGEVDEGCNCAVGTERACYLGPVGTLNRGACRAGNQRCESTGARAIWGECAGQVIPAPEIASNGVDDDCNGMTDEPGALCLAMSNNESATECGNGRDDDCDGRVDCLDPGCATASRCMTMRCTSATEDTCFGGVDEDCDGSIDCMDPDCARDPSCMPSVCPEGQTPVYTERTTNAWAAPALSRADAGVHGEDAGAGAGGVGDLAWRQSGEFCTDVRGGSVPAGAGLSGARGAARDLCSASAELSDGEVCCVSRLVVGVRRAVRDHRSLRVHVWVSSGVHRASAADVPGGAEPNVRLQHRAVALPRDVRQHDVRSRLARRAGALRPVLTGCGQTSSGRAAPRCRSSVRTSSSRSNNRVT